MRLRHIRRKLTKKRKSIKIIIDRMHNIGMHPIPLTIRLITKFYITIRTTKYFLNFQFLRRLSTSNSSITSSRKVIRRRLGNQIMLFRSVNSRKPHQGHKPDSTVLRRKPSINIQISITKSLRRSLAKVTLRSSINIKTTKIPTFNDLAKRESPQHHG